MKKKLLISIGATLLLIGGGFYAFFFFFQKSSEYDARLPILAFVPQTNIPLIEVRIDGTIYPFRVDLGIGSYFSVRSEILDKIQKEYRFTEEYCDVKGNKYEVKIYRIDKIEIRGGIKVTNVDVKEGSLYFDTEGSLIYGDSQSNFETEKVILGRVGRGVFKSINLFLDLKDSVMYACSQLDFREKDGYAIDKLVSAPFQIDDKLGYIFNVETDLGMKNFMLDTGATQNLIHPFLVQDQKCLECKPGIPLYRSEKFAFGGKDFGETEFLVFDMAGDFKKVDGIIGMEFLKDHVVYLDFKQKIAYIGKASEVHPQVSEEALAGMR